MNRIGQHIAKRTVPRHLSPGDGIRYWQERVLLSLLFAGAILGTLAYIPSVYLSLKESLFGVALADTLTLGLVLFLFFNPQLSYRFRASCIPVLSFGLGLILTFTLGPFGAGPVWLFFFPVLTGVLLGSRASVLALILNSLAVALIGLLIQWQKTELMAQFGFKPWHIAAENPDLKWVVICANFMLLNILSTVSVTVILNGLQKSLVDLLASEKKYRQIFENILDVYFELSLDGRLLEISPSVTRMSGHPPEALKGRSLTKLFEVPEKPLDLLNRVLAEERVNGYELNLKDSGGNLRCCSVNASLMTNQDRTPERVIGILRDITAQKADAEKKKELEARLNRSQKMEALGLLAGGVAHDLNNVLSGVVTYPELLLMDLDETSPMAHSLKIIHQSGTRASEIVQDLLTLSRRGVVTRQVVDLNAIVQDFLRSPECEKILSFHPQVTLEAAIEARAPQMKGSPVHLQKTVMNLISNAAEAQPSGGKIHISTRNIRLDQPVKGYDRILPGDYLLLTVEDQGEGIPPEDLTRIFEPFFTKKVMGRSGTGLGMAVVWGTVQDHGGYIDLTSSLGAGTRFDLYFPATSQSLEPLPESADLSLILGQGQTILVVDDVEHQRQIAAAALRRLRYDPVTVSSGEAAVDYLTTHRADLVLLDMIMDPGIDGLETLRRILKIHPLQKVVIASGFSKTRQVNEALELGAGPYIKKPYTMETLGMAIKEVLGQDS